MRKLFAMILVMALTGVAMAAPVTSNEFRLDCRTGVREARATEAIRYSTAWATNLTAAAQNGATAVVKVNPVLKTPPKYVVVDLSGGPNAARWPTSYLDEAPEGGWSDEYKTEKLVLRHIPAGSFIMGGRATDYPGAVNTNLHMVTLTKDFYMGVFEVTQRQWELAMGTRPSGFTNELYYATRPVERVSWNDVRGSGAGALWPKSSAVDVGSFIGVLRSRTGMNDFDLPTEAQWEYACRAGTTTALNSGVNLISGAGASDELNALGRNNYNGGSERTPNCDPSKGTALVGTYAPNGYGIYDMHGNVWEMCLDFLSDSLAAIDPRGPDSGIERVMRGGSWRTGPYTSYGSACISGGRGGWIGGKDWAYGFRLCLHSANIPDVMAGAELVRASGASAADWTPTKTGTYLLTHEVQTNGVPAAETLTALFRVGGPELLIEPQGELTNGVLVKVESVEKVEGGENDWPIYYTTDGSEPTSMSALYDGPFSLPSNAVVRAVAISEGGVSGDPARADFTLHDAFGLVGAVARPRYPWNGLVDVDFELRGDPDLEYLVSLEALDMLGGTNLPARTVLGETLLAPGTHRVTWNAAADIAGKSQFPQVSVTVKATGSVLNRYSRTLGLSVARYTGTETLSGVPTLVRLSEAIPGFRYADFASPADGADLAFFDADENELPYEIDEWNTNGESLVWVRLPVLTNGVPFTCAYGNPQPPTLNPQLMSHDVWRDYAGVWHMNEDAGTAFDSTEHHLDALPSCGISGDTSLMVAYENGACGRGRINAIANVKNNGNVMVVPAYDALALGAEFVISGWFNVNDVPSGYWPELFVRNPNTWTEGGWGVQFAQTVNRLSIVGSTNTSGSYETFACPGIQKSKWHSYSFCYKQNRVGFYLDGLCVTNTSVVQATDNGSLLGIGNFPSACASSFNGQYDEIRLRGGSLSSDRIKADYDMIADRNWLAYGIVRKIGAADEEDLGGVQLWENGPYWAECNVGATEPEEYGYYFWWGDTVGYKRVGDSWNAVDGSRTGFSFESANCPTYGKGNPELWAAGYADLSGNLTAAHDAATAHLGAPWRMPTDAECQALIDNCTTTWITTNGVAGRLVTGKGAYAYKSIFLPAAGYGAGRYCNNPGSTGRYWSSTQYSNGTNYAWHLDFDSGSISRYSDRRDHGRPVRPVRVFAQ